MPTAMNPQMTNPQQVVDAGQRIYKERYQEEYERLHAGKFVAIDVQTGNAYLADTAGAALKNGLTAQPQGVFHLIKIGSTGAFKVSYSPSSNANVDWNFR
jgi:hypothetical protein